MNNIICYATSGLGNRLKPLASCAAISKKSGRKLSVYWDNITPNGCLARFEDLFVNPQYFISLEDLTELDDCVVFSETDGYGHGYDRECTKFGRCALKTLSSKYPMMPKSGFDYSYTQKNVVIYDNGFQPRVNMRDSRDFIKSLKPIKSIQDKIDSHSCELGLNRGVIGVHARGTDFGDYLDLYTSKINNILNHNTKQKFFVSTEDPVYEKTIIDRFGDNILTRKNRNYVIRDDNNKPWSDHTSFSITKEHAQEAVEDMFLLAKTNIQIYHEVSTFCEISRILSTPH